MAKSFSHIDRFHPPLQPLSSANSEDKQISIQNEASETSVGARSIDRF